MSLATSANGEVWIAPVAYVHDENWNLFWYSEKNARHSHHIAVNQFVAAAIFDSRASSDDVDGLQIEGLAAEIVAEDLPRIVDLYFRQSFPDENARARWSKPTESFCDDAPQRFYKLTPVKVYKCDTANTSVDRRLLVQLSAD